MSQPAPIPADHWILRSAAGQEYGPVSFDTLRAWAAQNRFTAGYSISSNREDWRTVESVPELGMDWFVEPGDGNRYGPFHPLALLDYIREGAVPPETKVIHKGNGGVARAYQVLLEAFVDAIDQTGEAQAELIRQIQALQERLEERDRWFQGESRTLHEERERRQELEMAVRRLEEQGAASAAERARLAQLEAELPRVRKELDAERRAQHDARVKREAESQAAKAELERRIRELEQKLSAKQSGQEAASREKDLLAVQLAAERQARETERAHLQEQTRLAEETIRESRDESIRLRRDYETRLKEAETRAAEAAVAASHAEAKLVALQGRAERLRLEAEQAESATREATEIRGEAQTLASSLRTSENEKTALRLALEKERLAVQESRAEGQARLESEAQQREAGEALSREVTALRHGNADLLSKLEAVRGEAEEAARTEQELARLRQLVPTQKKRLEEAEASGGKLQSELTAALEREAKTARDFEARTTRQQAEQRQVEAERERLAAQAAGQGEKVERLERELETTRVRIGFLEARLADRPAAESKSRSAWAVPPVRDIPAAEEPAPPPRKAASLAGLEAQAQAELKAWQEKKQMGPKTEPPAKGKSWIPWK